MSYVPPLRPLPPPPPRYPREPGAGAAPCEWEAFRERRRLYERNYRRWERECRSRIGKATVDDLLADILDLCEEALDFDPLRKPWQRVAFEEPSAFSGGPNNTGPR